MKLDDVVRLMALAGCSTEQIGVVAGGLAAIPAAPQKERSSGAERQARYRARGGGTIPQDLRLAVFRRDDFACKKCGATDNLCCDHVKPVCRGGETTLENLSTLCKACNARKAGNYDDAGDGGVMPITEHNDGITEPSQPHAHIRARVHDTKKVEDKISSLRSDIPAKPNRVTRLTMYFSPSEQMRAVARSAGLSEQEIDLEGDKIRDWSMSAKGGAKLDWEASWRNWIKNRVPAPRAGPNGHHAKPPSALDVLVEIENGTRKPPSEHNPAQPFGAGSGPLIEGRAITLGERDDPGWFPQA